MPIDADDPAGRPPAAAATVGPEPEAAQRLDQVSDRRRVRGQLLEVLHPQRAALPDRRGRPASGACSGMAATRRGPRRSTPRDGQRGSDALRGVDLVDADAAVRRAAAAMCAGRGDGDLGPAWSRRRARRWPAAAAPSRARGRPLVGQQQRVVQRQRGAAGDLLDELAVVLVERRGVRPPAQGRARPSTRPRTVSGTGQRGAASRPAVQRAAARRRGPIADARRTSGSSRADRWRRPPARAAPPDPGRARARLGRRVQRRRSRRSAAARRRRTSAHVHRSASRRVDHAAGPGRPSCSADVGLAVQRRPRPRRAAPAARSPGSGR